MTTCQLCLDGYHSLAECDARTCNCEYCYGEDEEAYRQETEPHEEEVIAA